MSNNASRAVEAAARTVGASMVAGASAAVFYMADAPGDFVGVVAGATALAGGLSWLTGKHSRLPKAYVAFRSISTMFAAGWVWWASCAFADGPSAALPGLTGLAAFIAAPYLAHRFAWSVENTPEQIAEKIAKTYSGPGWEWWNRIQNICSVKLQYVNILLWENGLGYDVECQFKAGGYTIDDISGKLKKLASDVNLPSEGGIDLRPGNAKRDFILSVTEGNALGDKAIPFPTETIGPRSVYDDATFGIFGDYAPMVFANLRQNSMAVAGQNGAGKSGFLHNQIAHHAMCIDELVWVIDLNSDGKLAEQWLYAWEESGFQGKPPIDAVAGTVEEARYLIDFASQIAQTRAKDYRKEIRAAGDGDVPLSARIPGIRIIMDEPKMIFAGNSRKHQDLKTAITQLQETGRSVGIRPDYGVLGATTASLPPDIKKQIVHRAVMAVEDKQEMGYFLGWPAANAADMTQLEGHPGKVYVGVKGSATARLGRFYHIKSGSGESMSKIAAFAATVRPEIDDAAKRLPGYRLYAERWDRWRAKIQEDPMEVLEPEEPANIGPSSDSVSGTLYEKYRKLNQGEAAVETKPAVEFVARDEPEIDPFDAIVGELKRDIKTDPIRDAVISYLAKHGPSQTGDLIDWLMGDVTTLARPTLAGKLATYATHGTIENPSRGWWKLPD